MQNQRIAVIGHPIRHTMSPFIHKRLFSINNISCEYEVLDLPHLNGNICNLIQFDGFNVTIPYKTDIISHLAKLDPIANHCGSVNTVKVVDGQMYGYTTDGAGCVSALMHAGESVPDEILILGNGGAARAVAFAFLLQNHSCKITFCYRESSLTKVQALVRDLNRFILDSRTTQKISIISYSELETLCNNSLRVRYGLLANTTSVGMYPNVGASPVSRQVVSSCKVLFDSVYNPAETELLLLGKEVGVTIIGGMGMLVFQAAEAHRIWYGTEFQDEDMCKLILDAGIELSALFN